MGLQNQLSDISSESMLILTVVFIGKSVNYLRTLLLTILRTLGLYTPSDDCNPLVNDAIGSGLANLVVFCEQLSLNRACSYPNRSDDLDADCIVCLNRFGHGDHVRTLPCCHVFHKDCFDSWLDHFNFNCPLCRAPVASDDHMNYLRRRIAGDLFAWFAPH